MRPVEWGRVLTAMVTPFDSDLRVDQRQVAILARHLVMNGSDGIVVGGTTGESPTLSRHERVEILETVLQAVGDQAIVIAGTGTNSTVDSIQLTQDAENAGAHGVMLVTPYYNKPPQAGLVDHFSQVAHSTSLPVLLYNVPGRTGVNMLPSTVGRLAQVENIVAVKEASGNLDQVTEVLKHVPQDFLVYSGDDSLTLSVMSVGGHGIVSVASHIAGREIQEMIRAYLSGDVQHSARIHRRLHNLFKALFTTSNPIPVKAALSLVGIDVGGVRPPLSGLPPEEVATLREVLAGLGQ